MKYNCNQLTLAREYRGYSQSELSTQIKGLSQSNLSKFEKGVGSLSEEVLERIMSFLRFPEEFLSKKISHKAENAHYRKRAGFSKKDRMTIESSIKLIGYIVDQMAISLEFPEQKIKSIDLEEGFTPESAAIYTRKVLGLKSEPVKDINTILEKNGILIVEIDADLNEFDGVSFKTDDGFPVMIINKGFSNDRKRFTIAHELGHLILHTSESFIFPEHRDIRAREKEAHRFASEFLMPAEEIRNSLRDLRMSFLGDLKKYWLTSMASIVRRAYDLGCISADKYTMINIEFSRRGWKKVEEGTVYLDEPKLFYAAYRMHIQELEYTDEILSKAFSLPIDVISRFCKVSKTNSKLRVVV